MKKLLIPLSLLVIGILKAQTVPNKDWVRNFSDRNSLENVPAALDGSNNTHVTGYTGTPGTENFTTVKYNPSGTLLWTASYNNGASDKATAISLDNSGNVYVLGQSQAIGTGYDYALVKYNSSGVQQWVARYNGTGNGDDMPLAILVDNTGSGAIYVTGKSLGISSANDYATVKYNTSGVQLWVHRYNGTGNSNDEGIALALGSGNRLFVTGTAISNTSQEDITTLRIHANTGALNWVNVKNGTTSTTDKSYGLVLDGNDPVIVGQLNNTTTGNDYSIHKINGNTGVNLWSKTYDGFGGNDLGSSITKDAAGNFIVTGISTNTTGGIEYHTVKYNNAGTFVWVNKEQTGFSFFNVRPKVIVDILDHLYVLGQNKNTSGNSDVYLYQLAPSGNTKWNITHNGAANGNDAGVDFLVNTVGQLYVAAQTFNGFAKWDYTTIKISQTPVVYPPDFLGEAAGGMDYIENKGQVINTDLTQNFDIKYYNQNEYPNVFIQKNALSLLFHGIDTLPTTDDTLQRIDVNLSQSNNLSEIYAFETTNPFYNFFIDNLPHVQKAKGNKRLMIPNIYTNIDLHYYSNANGLKAYFVVKPTANPNDILLDIQGASSTSINGSGQLELISLLGKFTFDKPVFYQINMSGGIVPLTGGSFTLVSGSTYKFTAPSYSPMLPLIIKIDRGAAAAAPPPPIGNLEWSTYVGGTVDDRMFDMNKDNNDDVLICGYSGSANFPLQGVSIIPSNISLKTLGVFSKFRGSNGELSYSTYFGGVTSTCSPSDFFTHARHIDSDNNGHIFISGITKANGMFPFNSIGSNYLKPHANGISCQDAFIMRFDTLLNTYDYFSYLGGTNLDVSYAMRYNKMQNRLYLALTSFSSDFPLMPSVPSAYYSTTGNGIIMAMSQTCDTIWATRYGGEPKEIAFDNISNLCVLGEITSGFASTLPIFQHLSTAYCDSSFNGGRDVFFSRFNAAYQISYSTFMGGTGDDYAGSISQRDTVMALTGHTFSFTSNDTTVTTFKPINGGFGEFVDSVSIGFSPQDIWVVRLGNNSQLRWASLYGGQFHDYSYASAIDRFSNIYVSGVTASTDVYWETLPYGGSYLDNNPEGQDSYVLCFSRDNQRIWSTYYGGLAFDGTFGVGLSDDATQGMVVTNEDRLFLTGQTPANTLFPLNPWIAGVSYYDNTLGFSSIPGLNEERDGFLAMFDVASFPNLIFELEGYNENLQIGVYPNPNDGNFSLVTNEELNKATVTIYNNSGQLVLNEKLSHLTAKTAIPINLKGLSNGMYYICLEGESFRKSGKFIIH